MSDEQDIEGVEFEHEVTPESSIELTSEWVAWLEGEPVPDNVDGVDASMTVGSDPSAIA